MSDRQADLAAEAAKMTDERLIDSWQTASDQEKRAPSAFLRLVADKLDKRNIPR